MSSAKKEVTIITAFFDIGRKDFAKELARSNDKYLEYFKFWARIHNNLIVYTNSEMAEKVKEVRAEFGMTEKTKIVVIDDYSKIAPDFLARMQEVANSDVFLKYRYMPNPADNNAIYDYVMLLKSWCMYDAVENGYAVGPLVWMDFGINHGGDVFSNPLEFDTTLKMDLPEDKITLFSLKVDDNKPIFQVVQSYDVYIMGFLMYVPSKLAIHLWNDIKEAMNSLLDVGFIDDDQTLLLMISRKYKERYNVVISTWFMPLKDYGIENLTVADKKANSNWQDKLLEGYRVNKRNRACVRNLKSIFLPD